MTMWLTENIRHSPPSPWPLHWIPSICQTNLMPWEEADVQGEGKGLFLASMKLVYPKEGTSLIHSLGKCAYRTMSPWSYWLSVQKIWSPICNLKLCHVITLWDKDKMQQYAAIFFQIFLFFTFAFSLSNCCHFRCFQNSRDCWMSASTI